MDTPNVAGKAVDLDITFQLGNTVSFTIKADEKELLEAFKPDIRLSNIQCYSPMSLFNAEGKISKREKITNGPKQGDYNFDIIIEPVEGPLGQ